MLAVVSKEVKHVEAFCHCDAIWLHLSYCCSGLSRACFKTLCSCNWKDSFGAK